MQVRVFDSKLNIERVFTQKAYQVLQKQKHYTFLSYLDEDGNETEGQPQVNGIQKKSQVKSVEPAESKIEVKPQIKTPEQIEAKKAELAAMNQEAILKAEEKAAEQSEVKVRQKPGPKPKNNNA